MKLIRFGETGKEKAGVIINETRYDASLFGEAYDETFFETNGLDRLKEFIEKNKNELPKLSEDSRLGCPFSRPSKIVCIGLNYSDHAKETGAATPAEPVLFLKSTTSIAGPNDNIIIPRNAEKTDWEVELAIVIGRRASYVEEANALDYVFGYCLHNDVSERSFQFERNGTWDKGKGCDTFAPLGPFLATKGEIGDINNLRLWLKVNGEMMQDDTTANMIFKVPYLISYVSQFMTLLPGDVISTGTPSGVGFGRNPEQYLRLGDIVESGIDYLGTASQVVTEYFNKE